VERQNLTIRMGMRTLTRLTNAFSKKWENLWAAYWLHFAHYNFCRVHKTLRVTPAMEAGSRITFGDPRIARQPMKAVWLDIHARNPYAGFLPPLLHQNLSLEKWHAFIRRASLTLLRNWLVERAVLSIRLSVLSVALEGDAVLQRFDAEGMGFTSPIRAISWE